MPVSVAPSSGTGCPFNRSNMKYSISKEAMTIIVKELEATKGRCEIELMGLPLARSNPEDPSYQY